MHPRYLPRIAAAAAMILFMAAHVSAQCAGDCDGNGMVSPGDLITLMRIDLGQAALTTCAGIDPQGSVDVHDLLTAVNHAANSCPVTPTPTSVPGCETAKLTVRLTFDVNAVPDLAGLSVDLNYPPAAVAIPGSADDDSVLARVTDVSGALGFASVMDVDTNSDGQDDRVQTAYAGVNAIPPGPFEEVQFDCIAGAPPPLPASFTCSVSQTVDSQANPVTGVGCELTLETTSAPTPTTVATATPTATATGAVATATATIGTSVCGNNLLEAGETCDDGNTITNPPADSCPADCTIITCTPSGTTQTVAISFTPPAGKSLATITVLLEYPDGIIQIPGTGDDESVTAAVTNTPSGFLASSFDYDYALKEGIVGSRALTVGPLFRVTFDTCQGAAPPAAAQFKCTVLDAASTTFQPISGVTCSASPL